MKKSIITLDKTSFLQNLASRRLLALNVLMALVYFVAIALFFTPSNRLLFGLLIAGELFHLLQVLGFIYTAWPRTVSRSFDDRFDRPVDVFVTVCGEPVALVRKTVAAALKMDYPNKTVYILNDGYVAGKKNWRQIETMAESMGVTCITRTVGGGAKAGNINHALGLTTGEYVVIFDADHAPYRSFLRRTAGYFTDPKMGFVQTPQFYYNQGLNQVTRTAWSQQTLFFGPIMQGKDGLGSAFMCGTNMVLSRAAVNAAGGIREDSIAEDFLTSMYVHAAGYKSAYVPEVLAEGLAPEDFGSYYKQQMRWARGSLELVIRHNPFLTRGLTFSQRLQYSISSGFYLGGAVVAVNALLPLVFLYTGQIALSTNSMLLAMIFLPYIFLNLYTLQITSNYRYSFEAISFSLSAFWMQVTALAKILTHRRARFAITSKTRVSGDFTSYVIPHITYAVITAGGLAYALSRGGVNASLLANAAWVAVNMVIFAPFVYAALSTSRPLPLRRRTRALVRTFRAVRVRGAQS